MENAKELLQGKIAQLRNKAETMIKDDNIKFDKLIKSLLGEKVRATVDMRPSTYYTSHDSDLARFEINQLKEDGKPQFYSDIRGYIKADRIVLSLSLAGSGERWVEDLERQRIYQCVKLYDNEQKLIAFANKRKEIYDNVYTKMSDCINEVADIEREERIRERERQEREFLTDIVKKPIMLELTEPYTWNGWKIEYRDLGTIDKITEKTLFCRSTYGCIQRIKKADALSRYQNEHLCLTNNIAWLDFTQKQIDRLYEVINYDLAEDEIKCATFTFETQTLEIGLAHNIKTIKLRFNSFGALKLYYAMSGNKRYLDLYKVHLKNAQENENNELLNSLEVVL